MKEYSIKLFNPVPCNTINAEGICGKPALAGIVYDYDGRYGLQMFCRDCVKAMAQNYDLLPKQDESSAKA